MTHSELMTAARACLKRGTVVAKDANGVDYRAYRYTSPRGYTADIDADLVDHVNYPENLIAAEIAALHEVEPDA